MANLEFLCVRSCYTQRIFRVANPNCCEKQIYHLEYSAYVNSFCWWPIMSSQNAVFQSYVESCPPHPLRWGYVTCNTVDFCCQSLHSVLMAWTSWETNTFFSCVCSTVLPLCGTVWRGCCVLSHVAPRTAAHPGNPTTQPRTVHPSPLALKTPYLLKYIFHRSS